MKRFFLALAALVLVLAPLSAAQLTVSGPSYQEGTWTPGVTVNGSATGITYTNQIGGYTKIGRIACVFARITLSNNGAGTGNVSLSGLPFTSVAAATLGQGVLTIGYYTGLLGIVSTPTILIDNSGTTGFLISGGATAGAVLTDTNIPNTADMYFSGCYQTT